MFTRHRRKAAAFAAVAIGALSASVALAAPAGTSRGPSTPTDPYVLPVADGVATKSLLTVSPKLRTQRRASSRGPRRTTGAPVVGGAGPKGVLTS